jgi:hypothetical protein
MKEILPPELHAAAEELAEYFKGSFGDKTRIDYGTGHETTFVAWMCCLEMYLSFLSIPLFSNTHTHTQRERPLSHSFKRNQALIRFIHLELEQPKKKIVLCLSSKFFLHI